MGVGEGEGGSRLWYWHFPNSFLHRVCLLKGKKWNCSFEACTCILTLISDRSNWLGFRSTKDFITDYVRIAGARWQSVDGPSFSLITIKFCAVAPAYFLPRGRQLPEPRPWSPSTACRLRPPDLHLSGYVRYPILGHSWSLTFIAPASLREFRTAHGIQGFFPYPAAGETPVLGASLREPGNIPAPNPCSLGCILPLQRTRGPWPPFAHVPRDLAPVYAHRVCPRSGPCSSVQRREPLSGHTALGGWQGASCLRDPLEDPHPWKHLFLPSPQSPRAVPGSQGSNRHDPRVPCLDLLEGQPCQTCTWAVCLWPTLGS